MWHWINLSYFICEVMSKICTLCFIRGSKHLETIKALSLAPCAFICFLVFGTLNETLTLMICYLKALITGGEIQSKSSPIFMIIKITYPNLLHSDDVVCFLSIISPFINDLRTLSHLILISIFFFQQRLLGWEFHERVKIS